MASRKILVNFSNALPEAKIIVECMMKTEYVLMSYKCMCPKASKNLTVIS